MGVELPEAQAWEFLAGAHTGILTTLRADGWPVSLPVWFVALERRIYLWAPARTAKIGRVRRDHRACFLAESGRAWAEVRAVLVTGPAELVEDRDTRAAAAAEFGHKYAGFRMPADRLPDATRSHYAGRAALIRVTPTGRLVSWDNARVRLREGPEPG